MATMRHINTETMTEKNKKNKETWVIDIEKEYEFYDASEHELKLEKKCIYKWPSDLARTSSMSMHRTPHMASLGPYHHGVEPLQPMEHQKKRAHFRILKRCGVPITRFVHSLQDIEQELRDSYDNLDPKLPSDSFSRMMLIDGCFILELLPSGGTENSNWFDPSEPIFCRMRKLTITVGFRDMLLLENQIPLLVLKKLLEVEFGMEIDDRYLNRLICTFYVFGSLQIDGPSLHILDILRKCLVMVMPTKEQTIPSVGFIKSVCLQCRRLITTSVIEKGVEYIILGISILFLGVLSKQISKPRNMGSALRFHEAGIEFKRAKPGSGLKITFDGENGVLTLPLIYMEDNTAAMYMNLMAFERMHPKLTENNAVTSYVSFMDSLIHTAEDVSLLCSQGMMMNFLSSDEDAANVFNKLGDGTINFVDDRQLYMQLQSCRLRLECGESILECDESRFEAKVLPKPLVYSVSTCGHCLTGFNIYSDTNFCVDRDKGQVILSIPRIRGLLMYSCFENIALHGNC